MRLQVWIWMDGTSDQEKLEVDERVSDFLDHLREA